MMHYRTIFLSDVHLGARGCKAEELTDFLNKNTCDTLYLIGDILDFWKIKRSCYFPSSHVKVVQKVLNMAESGTEVFFIPGNHDEVLRPYCPLKFGNIKMYNEMVHETPSGKRLLIIHGDQFDVMVNAKWLMKLGDIGYEILMKSNNAVHKIRSYFGYEYFSLSAYLKQKVMGAVKFISKYESLVTEAVRSRGVDGVVCGHIHHAEIRDMDNFMYINCGDWCESCSAICEDYDGTYSLVLYHSETPTVILQEERQHKPGLNSEQRRLADLLIANAKQALRAGRSYQYVVEVFGEHEANIALKELSGE
jgi:UDP-2,3-diacylglucosamine pyrophosphatase LpxH